jgi:TetR/AcrR family transcriptional repressor of mexJK operon
MPVQTAKPAGRPAENPARKATTKRAVTGSSLTTADAPDSVATPAPPAKAPAGPGRPKDPAKRAAILDAARTMFIRHGYEGVSMDQIAAQAGVSKLTVYSHFGDKENLFSSAVASYCEQQLPHSLFAGSAGTPLRERLLKIARAFHALVSSPEAIAAHRMLCTPQLAGSPLAHAFWDAGPRRVQDELASLLHRRIAAGELVIGNADPGQVRLAASQLLVLLKGDPHAMLLFGCTDPTPAEIEAHLASAVDLFLRAYAPGGAPATGSDDP